MKELKRVHTYSIKQYERKGFGHSWQFIDCYFNEHLDSSVLLRYPLSDDELERFFNVFVTRHDKGEDVEFIDSTENTMNKLFLEGRANLFDLERVLSRLMGETRFQKNYEKKCYYLLFMANGGPEECPETMWVSEQCDPLSCLKMSDQLGKQLGVPYRIVLSDGKTEVDPELLEFALSEC